jgi:hypothetical protein
MERTETQNVHRRFEELCALAQTGSLSIEERRDLQLHLRNCAPCRNVYDEYAAIGGVGMAFLAGNDVKTERAEDWDDRQARQRLFASIRNQRPHPVVSIDAGSSRMPWKPLRRVANRQWAIASLAACMMIAALGGAYYLGESKLREGKNIAALQTPAAVTSEQHVTASKDDAVSDSATLQTAQISRLEQTVSQEQQEVVRLRAQASLAEQRAAELQSVSGEREVAARQLTEERDRLARQLEEAGNAYRFLQTELTDLKAEHSRSLLHTASLESEVTELTAAAHDRERRIKDDEQYLVSDRDIRELMGARKLYIADVFDVDSVSRTRKAFGRVFYTQNKSLVFYAFDLDHQPGAKNASVFQVWGQKDSEANGQSHPMNLGILYMDSETNRRWVLRSDDPKQLAEIDAVFVTVEPHGGSQKPTGKPLLYALLRKEANHP